MNGAAGPSSYLETVRNEIAIYTPKVAGTTVVMDSLAGLPGQSDFWFTHGHLSPTSANSFPSEPLMIWDDQIQRFIIGETDADFGIHMENFDLAVSKTAAPATFTTADWNFYQINTTETGFDTFIFGNLGYNHDALVIPLDAVRIGEHTTNHELIVTVSISDLAAGNPITPFKNDLGSDQPLRPTVMHDSQAGDPMWFVAEHSPATDAGHSIDVYKMTNVLSNSATATLTTLAVNPYTNISTVHPKQPDGTEVTGFIDSGILRAAEANNTLVATQAISVSATEDDARWYAIDVSSGTPVLLDQGNVSAGNNTYIYYPGIDINSAGVIGMSFMKSGTAAGQFVSVYVTGRTPADPSGTMETPVLVQGGLQNYHDFAPGFGGVQQAGHWSGISVDADGTFWMVNEFADDETITQFSADWGTAIGHFSIVNIISPTDLGLSVSGPAAASEGNLVYNVTITNHGSADGVNAVLKDTLPAGTSFVSTTLSGAVSVANGTFTLTIPRVAANTTLTGTLTIGSTEEGNISNTLVLNTANSDTNPNNDSQTVSTDVSDPSVVPSVAAVGASEGNNPDLVVATFTDPGGAEATANYSANIDWGDTQTSAGTISLDPGTGVFSVHGTHSYTEEGSKTITVTIHHDMATDVSVMTTVQIADSSVRPVGGFSFTAAEAMATVSGTVATFTDPGNATGMVEADADYSASINWGDGSTSPGAITNDHNGTWTVAGSHTYTGDTIGAGASEGTATITVSISHDLTAAQSVSDTAMITDPNVVAAGNFSFTVPEGSATVNGTVATFTDPANPTGLAEDVADYSANINWGDGTTSSGMITNNNGTWTVTGSHTYTGDTIGTGESEGTATITVTINHDVSAPQSVSDMVTITDPNLGAIGNFTVTAAEGQSTSNQIVATFTDPGNPTGASEDAADYSANIDWGDGTSSTGTVTNNHDGTWTVTGSHTYVGDTIPGGTGESEGTATITVTISHDLTMLKVVTDAATITDADIVATGNFTVTATEAQASSSLTVATFIDPGNPSGTAEDAADYSANINWGDGTTSAGVITNNNNGTWTVGGSHTYAGDTIPGGAGESEGTATITVTISHDLTTPQVVTDTATITDTNVAPVGGFSFTVREGSAMVSGTLATFTDPGNPTGAAEDAADYSASVDWGDGTTSAGTVTNNHDGTWTVTGSHTYTGDSIPGGTGESEGAATITVAVRHDLTTPQAVTDSAAITDGNVVATGGFTFTAQEGSATVSGTVATFTDPGNPTGTAEDAADYSASIDWGDGATSAGTITNNHDGTWTVTSSHTYAGDTIPGGTGESEGIASITVTINHDASMPQIVTDTATLTDTNVVAVGNFTVTATEGQASSSQTVATFTDPGNPTGTAEDPADYSASINWGDGTASTGTITNNHNGAWTVTGSHTYTGDTIPGGTGESEGTATITVTISHDATTAQVVTDTAAITDANVVATSGFTFTAQEGLAAISGTVATFTDPGNPTGAAEDAADYSASISWGDGATSTGTITNNNNGMWTVTGSHTYTGDRIGTGESEGPATIMVTIAHEATTPQTVGDSATVTDPSVTAMGGFRFSADEGVNSISQTVATFTDQAGAEELGDYSATISWGDNTSSAGQITLSGSAFTVTGSHTYTEEGTFTISTTVHHDSATDVSVSSLAEVIDQNVVPTGSFTFSAVEGNLSSAQTVATFTDQAGPEPASNYTAQIAWGDTSTSIGSISFNSSTQVFSVRGSHMYSDEGTHNIIVAIGNESAPAVVVNSTATIADAALAAAGQQLSVAEGVPVSGAIASFTDANPNAPLSDFSATIAWGDGMTSTGSISQSGRGFAVQGMHQYAHDGSFTASATVTDVGGMSTTASTMVVVTEPTIAATAVAVNGFEFTPLTDPAPATDTRVATFTHAAGLEPPGDFTATIDWGDGSSSTGTVSLSGTTYTVRATHIYTEEASFPIQVAVSEDTGGATATVRTTATTLEQLLPDGTRGTADQRWLGEVYRDLLGRAIDPVGLANATNALNMGVSRFQIVSAIETSVEYRMKLINHLYFTLLGRVADPMGMQVSLDILSGRSFLGGQPTIEQLKAMIISSDEYFAKHGSTNSNFLEGLFRDVIGRDIDNSALVALSAQLARGTSRNEVALEVLNSAQSAGVLVQRDYLTYLNRNADAANLAGWVNLLQTGIRDEDLLAVIIASDEFFTQTVG
jgi:hypothetical protein